MSGRLRGAIPRASTRRPMPDSTGSTSGLRGAIRSARAYVRGVLGEDHYERYLEFHQRTHPEVEPMTKAEYWRCKTDAQDTNPRSRCC